MMNTYVSAAACRLPTFKPSAPSRASHPRRPGLPVDDDAVLVVASSIRDALATPRPCPIAATDCALPSSSTPTAWRLRLGDRERRLRAGARGLHYILSDLILRMWLARHERTSVPDGTTLPYDPRAHEPRAWTTASMRADRRQGRQDAEDAGCTTQSTQREGHGKLRRDLRQAVAEAEAATAIPAARQGQTRGFDLHIEPSRGAHAEEGTGQACKRAQAIAAAMQAAEAAGMGTCPPRIKTLIGEILDPRSSGRTISRPPCSALQASRGMTGPRSTSG